MSTRAVTATPTAAEPQDSWVPMIVIAMGQMLMSFNVAALTVSMSGMLNSFNTPPTTVGTAIVMYSLGVSAFVTMGAKLGQPFGSKIFFQTGVATFPVTDRPMRRGGPDRRRLSGDPPGSVPVGSRERGGPQVATTAVA